MTLHLCQGPKCHTYETQSRIRGTKGNKVLRTRKARFNMNVDRDWIRNWEHYFCDERCMNDWLDVHMVQLINYVGIKNIPSETPIDIVKTIHKDWSDREYTRTTIKLLNQQTNNDTVTA
jgi:retron-type reverse transcriptase